MRNIEQQIYRAETLGVIAFAKGLTCAPCMDPEFMKLRCPTKQRKAISNEWVTGWYKAQDKNI